MSATSIVSIGYLEPVFSIILSTMILKEVLQLNQSVGGFLILAATYIGEKYKNYKMKNLFTLLFIIGGLTTNAQAPNLFKYQVEAREVSRDV